MRREHGLMVSKDDHENQDSIDIRIASIDHTTIFVGSILPNGQLSFSLMSPREIVTFNNEFNSRLRFSDSSHSFKVLRVHV
jgi:hypothetical protein